MAMLHGHKQRVHVSAIVHLHAIILHEQTHNVVLALQE